MADEQQMVHITPSYRHHRQLGICPTMLTRLVSWHRRNLWQVPGPRRWQLVSSHRVVNFLPAKYFKQSLKRWKSQGVRLGL